MAHYDSAHRITRSIQFHHNDFIIKPQENKMKAKQRGGGVYKAQKRLQRERGETKD